MEMSRRGAVPSHSRAAPQSPCPLWLEVGAVSCCWHCSGLSQALGWVPILEGTPGPAAPVGTRGSPAAPGLGVFNQNTRLCRALRLEARPRRPSSCTPCSGSSVPWGQLGSFTES